MPTCNSDMDTIRIRRDLSVTAFDMTPKGPRYLVSCGSEKHLVSEEIKTLIVTLQEEVEGEDRDILERLSRASGQEWSITHFEDAMAALPESWTKRDAERKPRVPLLIQVPLLNERTACIAGGIFAWLFSWPIAALVVALALFQFHVIVFESFRAMAHPLPLPQTVAMIGLVFLGFAFHEVGHAAAAVRFGAKPRAIGAGLYFVYPCLYTDVSDAWRLQRLQRCIVDLGGFYFQTILVVLASFGLQTTHQAIFAWFIAASVAFMLQLFNPFFKQDGYWLFSDATGIANLHSHFFDLVKNLARRTKSTKRQWLTTTQKFLLSAYALSLVAFIAFYGTFFVNALRLSWQTLQAGLASVAAHVSAHQYGDGANVLMVLMMRDGRFMFVLFALTMMLLQLLGMRVVARASRA